MDKGQMATEALLKEAEERINNEYRKAISDIETELSDYLRRYEKKDETWRKWVEDGAKTEAEYQQWRIGQMAVGKRWSDQRDAIAYQLYGTNTTAKNIVKEMCPEVFAENYNFSAYDIEQQAQVNTSFTLYSKEAVERLAKDNPDVLPPVGKKVAKEIAEGKAVRWNNQQLQSVMMQGILQGDSIPKLATRLANTVGDRDRKAAIRNARTMATGAQNAGRVQSYKNAKDMGIDLEQMWIATMDNRTRHTHRWIDGEVRPVGETFSNGCEYPADPKGDPAEIYNCRCTLRGVVKGLQRMSGKYRDTSAVGGMSYDEWRNAKAESNPITLPEEKAENIKNKYINEYKYGNMGTKASGAASGALNPDSNEAQQHAEMYYESVRHMKTDYKRIAQNTGFSEEEVLNVKNYVFMEKHDLGGDEPEYLYPNYDMGESWRRLIDGKDIQEHDITLLNHEIMERDLVKQGYSQQEAHRMTEAKYNYTLEADEYYGRTKKHKEDQ